MHLVAELRRNMEVMRLLMNCMSLMETYTLTTQKSFWILYVQDLTLYIQKRR